VLGFGLCWLTICGALRGFGLWAGSIEFEGIEGIKIHFDLLGFS
jgi:hypothetical protein